MLRCLIISKSLPDLVHEEYDAERSNNGPKDHGEACISQQDVIKKRVQSNERSHLLVQILRSNVVSKRATKNAIYITPSSQMFILHSPFKEHHSPMRTRRHFKQTFFNVNSIISILYYTAQGYVMVALMRLSKQNKNRGLSLEQVWASVLTETRTLFILLNYTQILVRLRNTDMLSNWNNRTRTVGSLLYPLCLDFYIAVTSISFQNKGLNVRNLQALKPENG